MLFIMLLGMDYLFTAPMQADLRFKEICVRRNLREFLIRYQKQRKEEDDGSEEMVTCSDDVDDTAAGGESAHTQGSTSRSAPILSDNAMSLLQSLLLVDARDRLTLS